MNVGALPLSLCDPLDFPSACQTERHEGQGVGASWGVAIILSDEEDEDEGLAFSACTECVELIEGEGGCIRLPVPPRRA